MPFLAISTGKNLTPEAKQAITKNLGEIITVIPGKNVGNLMVEITDAAYMVFNGAKTDECLYMSILLHGAAAHEAKSALVEKCCAMLAEVTKIPVNNIYITVAEHANWGALGKYL